jgi:hypothetical protein
MPCIFPAIIRPTKKPELNKNDLLYKNYFFSNFFRKPEGSDNAGKTVLIELSLHLRFMFKRLGISLCLLLAFVLLQAHNFIPHHHHDEARQPAHSHHHDHEHNHPDKGSDDDTDAHLPFADMDHSADFGKVVAKPQFENSAISKPVFANCQIIWLTEQFATLPDTPRPHPPDFHSSLHTIFLSHSIPLRAPPFSS